MMPFDVVMFQIAELSRLGPVTYTPSPFFSFPPGFVMPIVIALFALLLLPACGLKGDLYLPEEQGAERSVDDAIEQDSDKDSDD